MGMQVKYKMTMGLEPMDPADWIEIDEHYEEEIALRHKLVQEKRDIVIHSTPGVRLPWESHESTRQHMPACTLRSACRGTSHLVFPHSWRPFLCRDGVPFSCEGR